jgi:hypothetical protein
MLDLTLCAFCDDIKIWLKIIIIIIIIMLIPQWEIKS